MTIDTTYKVVVRPTLLNNAWVRCDEASVVNAIYRGQDYTCLFRRVIIQVEWGFIFRPVWLYWPSHSVLGTMCHRDNVFEQRIIASTPLANISAGVSEFEGSEHDQENDGARGSSMRTHVSLSRGGKIQNPRKVPYPSRTRTRTSRNVLTTYPCWLSCPWQQL